MAAAVPAAPVVSVEAVSVAALMVAGAEADSVAAVEVAFEEAATFPLVVTETAMVLLAVLHRVLDSTGEMATEVGLSRETVPDHLTTDAAAVVPDVTTTV